MTPLSTLVILIATIAVLGAAIRYAKRPRSPFSAGSPVEKHLTKALGFTRCVSTGSRSVEFHELVLGVPIIVDTFTSTERVNADRHKGQHLWAYRTNQTQRLQTKIYKTRIRAKLPKRPDFQLKACLNGSAASSHTTASLAGKQRTISLMRCTNSLCIPSTMSMML